MTIDTVRTHNDKLVFEGDTEEVARFLKKEADKAEQATGGELKVWIERQPHSVSATEYIARYNTSKVLELVREAIEVGDPNLHASIITGKITDLF